MTELQKESEADGTRRPLCSRGLDRIFFVGRINTALIDAPLST
jgi:hypothetical protein